MITNVQLRNWRSHEDTNLNFSSGTNALVGLMGGGKTSILDAICFAFFGTFPTLASKKIKLENILMKKPNKSDWAEVEVTFELNGSEWKIKRRIEKNRTATSQLIKDGNVIEEPQAQKVTDEIEKLLKLNYDLFTRAIYSEQNQLDMFLTLPKGQRMKKIDELLCIDKFEKARATTRSLARKFSSSTEDKRQLISSLNPQECLQEIVDIKKETLGIKEKIQNFEKYLSSIKRDRENMQARIAELKATEKRIRIIEQESNTAEEMIKSLSSDMEIIKESLMEYSEYTNDKIDDEIRGVENRVASIRVELVGEKAKLDDIRVVAASKKGKVNVIEEEKIPEFEKLIKNKRKIELALKSDKLGKIEIKLKKLESDLEKNNNNLQQNIARIGEIENSVGEFDKVEGHCPICDQRITPAKKKQILEKKKDNMKKLSLENRKLDKDIKKIKNDIDNFSKEKNDIEELKKQMDKMIDAEKQLSFLKEAKKQLEVEVKVHDNEIKMLEKNINVIEKNIESETKGIEKLKVISDKRKEYDLKKKRLEEYEEKYVKLKGEKQRFLGFSSEVIEKLEKDLQKYVEDESVTKTRIESLNSLTEEKHKRLDELEKKKETLDKYEAEIQKAEALSDQMNIFSAALLNTQDQLRKNFVSAVNQAMDMLWDSIYPYKDFYSCRLAVDNGDYVLQLQDSDGWINADGVVSGGERSIACLALRISFALVLAPQLRWLVLDEPTHNLDSRAVNDLSEVLKDKIGEFVEQVFLITHDPTMEQAVSGYLYRLERKKEKNEATRAVKIMGPDDIENENMPSL